MVVLAARFCAFRAATFALCACCQFRFLAALPWGICGQFYSAVDGIVVHEGNSDGNISHRRIAARVWVFRSSGHRVCRSRGEIKPAISRHELEFGRLAPRSSPSLRLPVSASVYHVNENATHP